MWKVITRNGLASLGLLPLGLLLGIFALAPLAWVFVHSVWSPDGWTLSRFEELVSDPFYRQAFSNSLKVSAWSSVLGLILSLLAATSLRRLPGRWRDNLVAITNMCGNLTGVPLAFAFIIVVGTNGALTLLLRQLGAATGFDLYDTEGLVLIYIYFQLPLGVLLLYPAFEALDDEWQHAAALLGAEPWHYWRHVALPVLMPSIAGAFILLFANAMGAYASAYALTQGHFNLLTVRIASLVAGDLFLDPEQAAAIAVALTLLLMLVTAGQQLLTKRLSHVR